MKITVYLKNFVMVPPYWQSYTTVQVLQYKQFIRQVHATLSTDQENSIQTNDIQFEELIQPTMPRTVFKTSTFVHLAEYQQPSEICFKSVYFMNEIMLLASI